VIDFEHRLNEPVAPSDLNWLSEIPEKDFQTKFTSAQKTMNLIRQFSNELGVFQVKELVFVNDPGKLEHLKLSLEHEKNVIIFILFFFFC
jgi:hypothetical protein